MNTTRKLRKVNDTLWIKVIPGTDPHIVIDRANAGQVRIEPDELGALLEKLVAAGSDLSEIIGSPVIRRVKIQMD